MKIYTYLETPIIFQDSSGSAVITLSNLAAGSARYSSRFDRGAGDLPYLYQWRAIFQFGAAPAVAGTVRLFLGEYDGGHADGALGSTDAAASEPQLSNLREFGCVGIQSATANVDNIASGLIEIWDRYFSVAVWNRGGAILRNSSNTSKIIFTPVVGEIQT